MAGREQATGGREEGREEEIMEEAEGALVAVYPMDRGELIICFDHDCSEDFVTLKELEAHLKQEQFLGVTTIDFTIDDDYPRGFLERLGSAISKGVGLAIRNSHPNLETLDLCPLIDPNDANVAAFLENAPHHLSHIRMRELEISMPLSFRALGRFRQLKTITLNGTDETRLQPWCDPPSFEALADSLENMPLLTRVEIDTNMFLRPQTCLEALFTVLGSNENDVEVVIRSTPFSVLEEFVGDPSNSSHQHRLWGGRYDADLLIPYEIDQKLWDTLKHGPTCEQLLNQARRRGMDIPDDNQYDGNLRAWVEAMICFKDTKCKGKDRLDVFHYLLSQLPPEALSNALLSRTDTSGVSKGVQTEALVGTVPRGKKRKAPFDWESYRLGWEAAKKAFLAQPSDL